MGKNQFAEILKKLSKEKEITQSDLARHLGLGRQAVSLYYLGKTNPELSTLIKIAEYFEVSLDYLVTGERPEHNQERMNLKLPEKALENLKNKKDSAARGVLLSDEKFYDNFSEAVKLFLNSKTVIEHIISDDKLSSLDIENKDILKIAAIEPSKIMENYFREFFNNLSQKHKHRRNSE